jgi:hypothetical protein
MSTLMTFTIFHINSSSNVLQVIYTINNQKTKILVPKNLEFDDVSQRPQKAYIEMQIGCVNASLILSLHNL